MATLVEDQCIALIVQDALKAATAPIRTRGRGGGQPTRASFLEGAWLSVPTSQNNLPSPSPLQCLTANRSPVLGLREPGIGIPVHLHPQTSRLGGRNCLPPLVHTVHFTASSPPESDHSLRQNQLGPGGGPSFPGSRGDALNSPQGQHWVA